MSRYDESVFTFVFVNQEGSRSALMKQQHRFKQQPPGNSSLPGSWLIVQVASQAEGDEFDPRGRQKHLFYMVPFPRKTFVL